MENRISFTSIKLSTSDYKKVRDAAMFLKFNNVDVLGHKTFYISNNFKSKNRLFNYIRRESNFRENQCGFVFLPWSKEAHILSSKVFEQMLFKLINRFDKNASINFLQ